MKKTLAAMLILAGLAAAIWFGVLRRDSGPATAGEGDGLPRYEFEAQSVVLRQMDARGRLQYEIEAERIVQLPDGGGIEATKPVFHHDPAGSTPGSAQRWTLSADQGRFPADGSTVTLSGQVRAQGTPLGSSTALLMTATDLTYDMEREEATSSGEVEVTAGANVFRGRGLRVNVATGRVTLESGTHAKISL